MSLTHFFAGITVLRVAWKCLSALGLLETIFLLSGAWMFRSKTAKLRLNEARSRVLRTVLDDDTDDDNDTEPSPPANDTATNDSSDTVVPEANDVDNDTGADATSSDAEVPEPRINNAAIANLSEPCTPVSDTSADDSRGAKIPALRDSKYVGPNFLVPRDTSAPELGDSTSPCDDPSDINEDTARVFDDLVAQLETCHIYVINQSTDLAAPVVITEQVVVQASLIDNNDRIVNELATATSFEQAAAPVSIAGSNEAIGEVPPVNLNGGERAYEALPDSAGAPRNELSTSSKQFAELVTTVSASEGAMDTSSVVKTDQPNKSVQATDAPEQRKMTSVDDSNNGYDKSACTPPASSNMAMEVDDEPTSDAAISSNSGMVTAALMVRWPVGPVSFAGAAIRAPTFVTLSHSLGSQAAGTAATALQFTSDGLASTSTFSSQQRVEPDSITAVHSIGEIVEPAASTGMDDTEPPAAGNTSNTLNIKNRNKCNP
ncbi:hypothetical protein GGH93_000900 [Coemansia aciculifera]|nr:hypothetical protein GGH93_000900 [Coemansia aciculifera]